jgi:hypothetical protein
MLATSLFARPSPLIHIRRVRSLANVGARSRAGLQSLPHQIAFLKHNSASLAGECGTSFKDCRSAGSDPGSFDPPR